MAVATDPVEDDPGDGQGRVEGPVSEQQGRHTPGHTLGVDDQDHRGLKFLGQLGVAVASVDVHGVEEPDVALDDTDVCARHLRGKAIPDLVPGHGVEVQVETGLSRRLGEPEGIYVVRPLLEGLHHQAQTPHLPAQADGDRGLAGALVGRGDIEVGHGAGPLGIGVERHGAGALRHRPHRGSGSDLRFGPSARTKPAGLAQRTAARLPP